MALEVIIAVTLMLPGPSPTKSDDVPPPPESRGLLGGAYGFPCYTNCDKSTVAPCLNINDFMCFINLFSAGSPYANCDASTFFPTLNVIDYLCFLNRFAAGCTDPCNPP